MRLSLSARLLLVVFAVVVLLTGVLGYLDYRAEKADNLRTAIQDASDFGVVIDGVLHAAMLDEMPQTVAGFIDRMESPEEIVGITVFDARGSTAFTDTDAVLPPDGETVLRTGVPSGQELVVEGVHVYRSFRPIDVGGECFRCHGESDPIGGVIQLDLSLERGYTRLAELRDRAFAQSLALGGSLVAVLWVMLSLTLVRPLRLLRQGARRLAEGELSARVPSDKNDELGDLARDFNIMADQLQARINEVEDGRERLQTSIHRVAEALSSALDARSIIQILLSESLEIADFDYGGIVLVDGFSFCLGPGGSLATADDGSQAGKVLGRLEEQIDRLAPASSETAGARTLHRTEDAGLGRLDLPAEWETVVLVPMVAEGTLMGHLVLASSRRTEFDVSQRRALEFLGTQGASAVAHSRLHERTREMAITDGLTGLFDHRHFYERLEVEMARAARYALPLSLILLDIDHFKLYNDRLGHRGGDHVLRRLSAVLRSLVRETDTIARYGGEEFTIILPHTGLADAVLLAERLRRAVQDERFPHFEGQPGGHLTISAGVATRSEALSTAEQLVEAADHAMYTAKDRGRNQVVAASPSLPEPSRAED